MGDQLDTLFDKVELTEFQRKSIKERFHYLMAYYRTRCLLYSFLFYSLRMTMTLGSLAIPALLSTDAFRNSNSPEIYWFTWSLSLAVTSSNALITLFKLDKRYFMLHSTLERLRSETWQYLQLSGRYSGHYGSAATHASQFVFYCTQFEKINMKRVEDEFIKEIEDRNMKEGVKKAVSEEQYVPFPAIPAIAGPPLTMDSMSLAGGPVNAGMRGPGLMLSDSMSLAGVPGPQETHIQIEDATDGPTADKNQIKEVPVSGPA